MKKFVGLVNGKSFDNEKDFNEAAKTALKSDVDSLSITSYYSYSDDNKEEEKVNEKVDAKYLLSNEYILVSCEPELNADKKYVYPISDELRKKIENADNNDDIKENASRLIEMYSERIKEWKELQNTLTSRIESLQSSLYENETELKKLDAMVNYYNDILVIVDKKEENKENANPEKENESGSSDVDDKQYYSREEVKHIFDSLGGFYNIFRNIGLFS